MKWLHWNSDSWGIMGALLALVVVVGAFAFLVIYFPDFQQRRANAGFGPDWECTRSGQG